MAEALRLHPNDVAELALLGLNSERVWATSARRNDNLERIILEETGSSILVAIAHSQRVKTAEVEWPAFGTSQPVSRRILIELAGAVPNPNRLFPRDSHAVPL